MVAEGIQALPQIALKYVEMALIKEEMDAMIIMSHQEMGIILKDDFRYNRCSHTCAVETGYTCSGGGALV